MSVFGSKSNFARPGIRKSCEIDSPNTGNLSETNFCNAKRITKMVEGNVVEASKIWNHGKSKLYSFKTTDKAESEKGNEHIQAHQSFQIRLFLFSLFFTVHEPLCKSLLACWFEFSFSHCKSPL